MSDGIGNGTLESANGAKIDLLDERLKEQDETCHRRASRLEREVIDSRSTAEQRLSAVERNINNLRLSVNLRADRQEELLQTILRKLDAK